MKNALAPFLAAALAAASGCSSIAIAPLPAHPTFRTFNAPCEKAFKAALAAVDGLSLASVDSASGIIITDWMSGKSDSRFVRGLGGQEPLAIRFKFVIRVERVQGGASRVRILNSEYTAKTEYVYTGSAYTGAGRLRSMSGPSFSHGGTYVRVEKFVKTPSSTAKEKALLDSIERILRSYYAGRNAPASD